MKTQVQLIQTTTDDDLILNGLYCEGSRDKEAIIFIHGFMSDFYSHKFQQVIADKLAENSYAFILAQTRGTGERTEILKTNRLDSVELGSYYEEIEEAHLDISAWIQYLIDKSYTKIVLIGHSYGTLKSIRYLFEGKYIEKISRLVLLAPFDKNGYIEDKTDGQWHNHLKIAEEKIKNGQGLEVITSEFDDYPVTYKTYYSWYKEDELNLIWDFYKPLYISPILKQITIPIQVIVGEKDVFFCTPELNGSVSKSSDYLKNNIKNLTLELITNSGHCYVGFEDIVAENILTFLKE